MSNISFFALGGLDEKGKNCFILEINKNYYIFDVGIIVPNFSKLGIRRIMFDYTWIQKNYNKVKGIFIGVANSSNIGALQFLNNHLKNIPIYTSKVNSEIINILFNEKSMQNVKDFNQYKINIVEPLKPFSVSGVEFTAFSIVTMIPNSIGFCIKTADGYITIIDEFIVSPEENRFFESQIELINTITNNNNLLLITAVGIISENINFTSPFHNPSSFLEKEIKETDGRLIIGAYDYNWYLLIKIIETCVKLSQPIIITNGMISRLVKKFEELKIIPNNALILNIKQAADMKKGVIIISSGQDKLFNYFDQVLTNKNKFVIPKKNDKYLLAIKTIPGYEYAEAKIYDNISYLNYDYVRFPKTILEARTSLNDHLFLLSLLKPKYIIPVKGLYFNFNDYYISTKNFKFSNIIILDNGYKINFVDGKLLNKKPEFEEIQEKYIGSYGLKEIDNITLSERKTMSESGIVLFDIVITKKDKQIEIINYKLSCFGIIEKLDNTITQYDKMIENVKNLIINNYFVDNVFNKELKSQVKKMIFKYFNKEFQKMPIVLPSIIEINNTKLRT